MPAPEMDAARTQPAQDHDPLAAEPPYPYQELLGFEITEWADNHARVELDLRRDHFNRHGLPHGGVHAALLDTCFGYASCWCPHPGRVRRAMTLSLTVNYVGQAQGRKLIAEGRVTGGGRKSFFAEGELRDDRGNLVATASASMRWRGNGGDPMGDPAQG
ncbi:MAG: PaaI family thioesterase [Pseudomonadota bacterium]